MARFTVALVGVDGSGKGTYISFLRKSFRQLGYRVDVVYLGHSNHQIKWVSVFNRFRANASNGTLKKIYRFTYCLLFVLDIFLRCNIKRDGDFIIYDRHPFFEPLGENSIMYKALTKFVLLVSPRPCLVVCLTGDIEKIWERKKEHSLSQMIDLNNRLMCRAQNWNKRLIYIDTTSSEKEQVFDSMFKYVKGVLEENA